MNRRPRSQTFQQLLDEQELAERVKARLLGYRWRVFVLARSFTQFSNWCCDHPNYSVKPPVYVTLPCQLDGLHLIHGVIELVKLDQWDENAGAALLHRVRILEATAT